MLYVCLVLGGQDTPNILCQNLVSQVKSLLLSSTHNFTHDEKYLDLFNYLDNMHPSLISIIMGTLNSLIVLLPIDTLYTLTQGFSNSVDGSDGKNTLNKSLEKSKNK